VIQEAILHCIPVYISNFIKDGLSGKEPREMAESQIGKTN
jgi:hypothetical protein